MRSEFITALTGNQADFALEIAPDRIERLADYYELLLEQNAILHLVAPCTAEEFAVRHVLESLTLLEFLPQSARFADIGPGGGLPSIPCLIVRDDLKATLIESKIKKAAFLNDVVARLELSNRVIVVNRQFEEATAQNFEIVTCRALDKFAVRLRRLVRWSAKRRLLLFGGPGLEDAISELHLPVFARRLMPLSQQRFLFVIDPK